MRLDFCILPREFLRQMLMNYVPNPFDPQVDDVYTYSFVKDKDQCDLVIYDVTETHVCCYRSGDNGKTSSYPKKEFPAFTATSQLIPNTTLRAILIHQQEKKKKEKQ